jgi:hypothetical protein
MVRAAKDIDYSAELHTVRSVYVAMTPSQRLAIIRQRLVDHHFGPNRLVTSVSAVEALARSCLGSRQSTQERRTALRAAERDGAVCRAQANWQTPCLCVHLQELTNRPAEHQDVVSGSPASRHRKLQVARSAPQVRDLAPPGWNTHPRTAASGRLENRRDGRALRARRT